MSFKLKILGSNSAVPAHGRHHSAQLLHIGLRTFLVDCGEGTQLQLINYKSKFQKIERIFISHLHGDHYLGLVGLIKTMHLQGRKHTLYLYGPRGLQEIITTQLKYSSTVLGYDILFEATAGEKEKVLFEDDTLIITSFPLCHRISCSGFVFREKTKPRRIDKGRLPSGISHENLRLLKAGGDIRDDRGNIILRNDEVTLSPKKPRSYAYCSDTKYDEGIIPYIQAVDLLYHEATFLEENEFWAEQTFHSTTKQAAMIALKAGAEKLLIGHFSSRYKDLNLFEEEARTVFTNTHLAIEGEEFEVLE